MKTENLSEYRVIRAERIEEMDSFGTLLEHKKSGAHVFVIENNDNNKVFDITFRTPSVDSTGSAHILEHSVLCGSEKYPVKDPFIELAKGSMNTFLNAITFPDKTCYPVASTNDKDFENLMSVYLDAVFHPNVMNNEKIFRQEGWRYEMPSEDSPISINGVVYNEMKGAFSSGDETVERLTYGILYPDTSYACESGGDPKEIPTLTYDRFRKFYRRYYHPSNSYIYLYGNCEMERILKQIDREYLSRYDRIDPDSGLKEQKPFDSVRESEVRYNVTEAEAEDAGVYYSWNRVCPDVLDVRTNTALHVLDTVLLNTPGAPVHEALSKAEIGKEIYGGYDDQILQPHFNVTVKEAAAGQKDRFVKIIEDTLRKTADEGIPEKSLTAALNSMEFRMKECDYGRAPKGLIFCFRALQSWLYDEKDPFLYLEYEDTFRFLRENLHTGYFENLIRTILLDNTFGAVITVSPDPGMSARGDKELADRLAAKKASLSAEEKQKLIADTAELVAYQKEESTPEQLASIPMLSISDLSRGVLPVKNTVGSFEEGKETPEDGGNRFVYHDIFTSGISYLDLLFPADMIPNEDLPYLGILRDLLTNVSTQNYSYHDLNEEIDIQTGGIGADIDIFTRDENGETCSMYLTVSMRALDENLDRAMALTEEIIRGTVFTEADRIKEQLQENQVSAHEELIQNGHTTAVQRGFSYHSAPAWLTEQISGIDYYRFLCDLTAHYEERKEELARKLQEISGKIFRGSGMIASFTGSKESAGRMKKMLAEFAAKLPAGSEPAVVRSVLLEKKNEGFMTSSQVQYTARTGDFRKAGLPYTGALLVLQGMLNYEYLWNNLRVEGGAYGCMSGFRRYGLSFMVSYRDPNLARTNAVYNRLPEYLHNYAADERTMTKFIIGAVSEMDTPMTPVAEGRRDMSAYLSGVTEEDLQRQRDEVLGCTPETIRGLEPYAKALLSSGCICTVGSESKITEDKDLFGHLERL